MIAIKNMEMPSCCVECNMFDKEDMYHIDGRYAIPNASVKPEWCPLVEIEKEGIPAVIPFDNVQEHKATTQRELICNLNAMNDELQAKLDKIEQITDKWIILEENSIICMREIRELLNE